MSWIPITVASTGLLASVLASSACSNSPKTTTPATARSQDVSASGHSDANVRGEQCPLSHEQLGNKPAPRTFASHQILFLSEAEASTFDELPGEQKRVVAGRQVLARRGVANEQCIVTQDPLPIDAKVVRIQGVLIGFTAPAQHDQFNAIPQEVREDLIAPYLVRASGISNTHCPITGELLHVDCPTIHSRGVLVGMADQAALAEYEAAEPGRRNEIVAIVVLPARGVTNKTCPITKRPLRLDSPLIHVDGQLVGVRNVNAARTFNQLNIDEQRDIISNEL